MRHDLKCWTEPYQAILNNLKRFELRKNDRPYAVGDILHLQEWNPDTGYTGRSLDVEVTWMLSKWGDGLPEGYCIMSISQPWAIFDNETGMGKTLEEWEELVENRKV